MKFLRFFVFLYSLSLLFSGCKSDRPTSAGLYSAVPKSSVLIIETRDLAKSLQSLSQTTLYHTVDSLPPFLSLSENIRSLKSHFPEDSLSSFFKKRTILITTTLSGAEKYDLLFITPGDREFEKMIGAKLAASLDVSKKNYAGAEIYHFYKKDNSRHYYVSSFRDLILFSSSGPLLEEGIRQMNTEFNIKQDPGFKKLYGTSNKKDLANLYVNLEELPDLLKTLLPMGDHLFLNRMGKWAEMDIQAYNKELIMSGLIFFPEEGSYYPQTFKNVDARQTQAEAVIPANSGLWISHTFANAGQYYRNYLKYLEKAGRLRKHEQLLEKLPFDHEKMLLNWVDTEMGIFTAAGKAGHTNYVAYLKFRAEEDARKALDSLASTDFIEGYRGIIIRKLAQENALPRFYGSLFQEFHYPYFIVAHGFALFAEDITALKGVVNDILDGKTLSSDEEFQEFSGNIPSEAHIKVIMTNPGFLPFFSAALEGSDARILEKHQEKLSNFRWASFQINVDNNAAYTNFYMLHAARQAESVARLWNVQLQSEAANAPQFLKNHTNARYDVAVQDKDHRLYLIDYSGKVLWTKNLDGPIMGKITQIDIFKNNKLQMVFNTSGSLYVVDRLGRDVENFPVKLEDKATAPVGVFNYDQARNYRLMVPTGPFLKNYNVEGKEVEGWEFKKADSDIITQPQHFMVNKKDVIVILTEDGNLQQLDRRGLKRFETIKGLPKLQIPFYLKAGETLAKSQMLANGPDGKLYAIFPGGTADNLYLDESNPADFFTYFDNKYIFTHAEKLFVKSDESPWNAELEGDISERPKVMIFGREFYAAAFSKNAEEIRLFNKKGELVDGFPVYAQGSFDMGSLKQDGTINIVTSTDDGTLICYRVN